MTCISPVKYNLSRFVSFSNVNFPFIGEYHDTTIKILLFDYQEHDIFLNYQNNFCLLVLVFKMPGCFLFVEVIYFKSLQYTC